MKIFFFSIQILKIYFHPEKMKVLLQCLSGEFDSNPTKASLFSQVYFGLLNTRRLETGLFVETQHLKENSFLLNCGALLFPCF